MRNPQDIYFSQAWHQLYAERENKPLDHVSFSCDAGDVEYGFFRRPVVVRGEPQPYEDIMTPYAFAGPELFPREDTPECRAELARQFDRHFQQYCDEQHIVAEYAQFSPWLKNHEAFADLYQLDLRSGIIGVDLTKPDIFMDELNGRRRRAVRSAMKQGVEIFYDTKGEMIDEFLRIYDYTVQKYDATNYYRFDRPFLERMFELLPGKVAFAYAMHEGHCINICMIVWEKPYVHYHLAGNDPAASRFNGNSLLIYDIARRAQEQGYELLVLGGSEGNMSEFKSTFTRSAFFDYYAGKRIRNQAAYDMLVEKNGIKETPFFPAYRDNGSVQYMIWLKDKEKEESE